MTTDDREGGTLESTPQSEESNAVEAIGVSLGDWPVRTCRHIKRFRFNAGHVAGGLPRVTRWGSRQMVFDKRKTILPLTASGFPYLSGKLPPLSAWIA